MKRVIIALAAGVLLSGCASEAVAGHAEPVDAAAVVLTPEQSFIDWMKHRNVPGSAERQLATGRSLCEAFGQGSTVLDAYQMFREEGAADIASPMIVASIEYLCPQHSRLLAG